MEHPEGVAIAENGIPPQAPKTLPAGPSAKIEELATGSVGLKLYWEYLRAARSDFNLFVVTVIFIATQVAISSTEWWLTFW